MDIYHIWCNLKPGVSDLQFVRSTQAYLGALQQRGKLVRYRIMRCKLGLRPATLTEFHLMLEFDNLAQLDDAFSSVASRAAPIEHVHHAVNSLVKDVSFALYRDFPDAVRVEGEELF